MLDTNQSLSKILRLVQQLESQFIALQTARLHNTQAVIRFCQLSRNCPMGRKQLRPSSRICSRCRRPQCRRQGLTLGSMPTQVGILSGIAPPTRINEPLIVKLENRSEYDLFYCIRLTGRYYLPPCAEPQSCRTDNALSDHYAYISVCLMQRISNTRMFLCHVYRIAKQLSMTGPWKILLEYVVTSFVLHSLHKFLKTCPSG